MQQSFILLVSHGIPHGKYMTKPKSHWDISLLNYLFVRCSCSTSPQDLAIAFFWGRVKEELMKSKEMLVFYIIWFSLCCFFFPVFLGKRLVEGLFVVLLGFFLLLAAVVGVLSASHYYQPLDSFPGSHTEQATIRWKWCDKYISHSPWIRGARANLILH